MAEICFRIAGGIDQERLRRILAAWSILFAVSGPLDDYVDRDKLPAEWDALGQGTGTFVALALIAEAILLTMGSGEKPDATLCEAGRVFTRYLKEASLGQAMDALGVQTLEAYEAMLARKAGSLVAALTESIAVIAEADSRTQHAFADFGHELGLAIQIVNDYQAGLWRPDVLAKDGMGDLDGPKRTYPIFFALQVTHTLSGEFHELLAEKPGRRNVPRMLEILNEMGVPEFMLAAIEVRRTRAIRHLEIFASSDELNEVRRWCDAHLLGR